MKQKQLPPIEDFFNNLKNEKCSASQYTHAQQVWNGCRTFKDSHDLYLETDVLLLADVFEEFRKSSLEHFELDPAHSIYGPQLNNIKGMLH